MTFEFEDGGLGSLATGGEPVPDDATLLELEHGSSIRLGGFAFDVIHAPGHTSGSICLFERSRGLLVTGDTALARGNLPPAWSHLG
jgi:glyoxylase-like metal-dependent hydrolase (beta-lactamase superfamily II)